MLRKELKTIPIQLADGTTISIESAKMQRITYCVDVAEKTTEIIMQDGIKHISISNHRLIDTDFDVAEDLEKNECNECGEEIDSCICYVRLKDDPEEEEDDNYLGDLPF